jgi:predicted aldo/keto reductase-like oxidoreductase
MNAPGEGRETALATLGRALEQGIRFFDTSETYGANQSDGSRLLSEELIRDAVRAWGREEELVICTKGHGYEVDSCLKGLHGSRERLGLEGAGPNRRLGRTPVRLVYLLHGLQRERWETVRSHDTVAKALRPARAEGLIDGYGFSGHDHRVLKEAIESGWFECVEARYNAFNRSGRQTAGEVTPEVPATAELLQAARSRRMGVINMKPFGGNGMQPVLKMVATREVGLTHSALLRYGLASEWVDVIIPGARTPAEVDVCVAGFQAGPLEEAARRELEAAADAVNRMIGGPYCRACRHCLDDADGYACPQGVDFIEILTLDARRKVGEALGLDVSSLRAAYAALPVQADDCEECGGCQERCLYQIPVVSMLAEAHTHLTG